MTLLRVRNKSRIRIRKEAEARKRAMTVTKIQGKTMAVDGIEVMAVVAVVVVLDQVARMEEVVVVVTVVIVLDQVARMEVFNPTQAQKINHRPINVEELTAARENVKEQSADWS
jgi:hypothetical protein